MKRNEAEYDAVGVVAEQEAEELLDFVKTLKGDVVGWLKVEHADLMGDK